jgi:hypothetical protein
VRPSDAVLAGPICHDAKFGRNFFQHETMQQYGLVPGRVAANQFNAVARAI